MSKVSEKELLERIYNVFAELSPAEFTEEVNRILGTNYSVEGIDFDNQ